MDNRKSINVEDCVTEVLNILDVFRDEKEKAKEDCENSNIVTKRLNKIGKMITILTQGCLALISLYFVITPKEMFYTQNIEWILFVVSVLTIIHVTIFEVKWSDKCNKYLTVLKYYHKVDEIVDNIIIKFSKNKKDANFVFDSYLKIQQLCREYELEEANKKLMINKI